MPDSAPPTDETALPTGPTGEEPLRFEDRLARLESLLEQLERGDLPLDEAIKAYEAGVAELRQCYQLLDAADERVRYLTERPADET